MIAEKYGKLKTGVVPEFPKYEVADFKKRELVKERLSPVRINLMGYRTMPDVHPETTSTPSTPSNNNSSHFM